MTDRSTNRRNISIPEHLEEEIIEAYPAANSPAQAIVLAAQDGLQVRQSYGNCFEERVREIVRDELENGDQ